MLPTLQTGYKDYGPLLRSMLGEQQYNALLTPQGTGTQQAPNSLQMALGVPSRQQLAAQLINSSQPSGGLSQQSLFQSPSGPSQSLIDLQNALRIGSAARGLIGAGGQLLGSSNIGGAGAGLGAGLAGAGAGLAFSQGNYPAGALGTTQALAQLAQTGQYFGASPYLGLGATGLGTAGAALGGLTGLAGAGYLASQGDEPGAIASGLGGAAGTLGALSGAGLLGGTGLGMLVPGLNLWAGTAAAGILTHNLIEALGLGTDNLPYGKGYSSADTLTSQKSKAAGQHYADSFTRYLMQPRTSDELYGIALAPYLSPNAELTLAHDIAGQGGTRVGAEGQGDVGAVFTETDPRLRDLVMRARAGDPQAIREFISGVRLSQGETGLNERDWRATDWYRRALLNSLPPELQAAVGTQGLFEPTPYEYTPEADFNYRAGMYAPGRPDLITPENALAAYNEMSQPGYQIHELNRISPYFRSPEEYSLSPERLSALREQYAPTPQQQISPEMQQVLDWASLRGIDPMTLGNYGYNLAELGLA